MTSARSSLVPWKGLVICALAIVVMIVAGVIAWPQMSDSIVMQHAHGNRGEMTFGRLGGVILGPALTAGVALLLAVAPMLDRKLRATAKLGQQVNPRGGIRVLDYTLGGLAIVFVVVDLSVLGQFTGSGFPTGMAISAAIGLLLTLLGIVLPLARPDDTLGFPGLERARAVVAPGYRAAGAALVIVGILVIATSFIWTPAALIVGIVGMLVAILVGVLYATGRARNQRPRN